LLARKKEIETYITQKSSVVEDKDQTKSSDHKQKKDYKQGAKSKFDKKPSYLANKALSTTIQ